MKLEFPAEHHNVPLNIHGATGLLLATHPMAQPQYGHTILIRDVPAAVPISEVIRAANETCMLCRIDQAPIYWWGDLGRGKIINPCRFGDGVMGDGKMMDGRYPSPRRGF